MNTRTIRFSALAGLALAALAGCNSGSAGFKGVAVQPDVVQKITTASGVSLGGKHLTVYKTVGTANFVSVDGAAPTYPAHDIEVDTAVAANLVPQLTGASQELLFSDPAVIDVNPLTIKVVAANPAVEHYLLYTTDAGILSQVLGKSVIKGGGSGLGFTKSTDTTSITFLSLKLTTAELRQEATKALAVELCNQYVIVTPATDAVTRSMANNKKSGGHVYSQAEMTTKLTGLLQDTFCNSFGYAAAQARAGVSYADYLKTAQVTTILSPGKIRIVIMPPAVYASLA